MNQNDGNEILKELDEFINIELSAGNRITKNNGSYILSIISVKIKEIFLRDTNKEKLWEEYGKEWIKKNEEKQKQEIKKKSKKENIINVEKTISSKLLDEKLKKQ